jgi:hypothetical protein
MEDKENTQIPKSIKYSIYILLLAFSGVILGLGLQVLSGNKSEVIEETKVSSPDSTIVSGDGVELKFDDGIKDWNLKAAPYISPLLSQLSREVRSTLGSQKALCQFQRDALSSVLLIEEPEDKKVAKTFNLWRNSLKNVLDQCLAYKPSGDDAKDIKNIYQKIVLTEKSFDAFLKSQINDVDIKFERDPKIFE